MLEQCRGNPGLPQFPFTVTTAELLAPLVLATTGPCLGLWASQAHPHTTGLRLHYPHHDSSISMGPNLITMSFSIASEESRMLRVRASLVDGARAIMGAMVSRAGNQKLCRTIVPNTQGETVPQQRQIAMKATRVCPVMPPQRRFSTRNAKCVADLRDLEPQEFVFLMISI